METTIQLGFVQFQPRNECAGKLEQPESVETVKDAASPGRLRSHPLWIRMEQAILIALMPFVEARRAVSDALESIDPEPESPA